MSVNALARYRSSVALLEQLAGDDPRAKTIREDLAELAGSRAWFEGSLAAEEDNGLPEDLCPYSAADKIDGDRTRNTVNLRDEWIDGWESYEG
jgi:hypothetical protein